MAYAYTNGDGVSVLLVTEPDGATEPVSILDQAVRQIKSYLNDPLAGPAALVSALLPTGMMINYGGSSAPSGWLLCDGSAVSRTTYAALFAVIGTTYGAGDASTTFNLPDLQGKFALGAGGGFALGATGGEEDHLLTVDELPAHDHDNNVVRGADDNTSGSKIQSGDTTSGTVDIVTSSVGGDQAHNNMPPYTVSNVLIKI